MAAGAVDLAPFDASIPRSVVGAPHIAIARMPGAELNDSPYAGFVYATFAQSLRLPTAFLGRELSRPGAVVLVATPVGDPTYVGWLAAVPSENRIICAYTKAAYRASHEQRAGGDEDGFRIASTLAISAGISFGLTVPCSLWSRSARAIFAKPGNPYGLSFQPGE